MANVFFSAYYYYKVYPYTGAWDDVTQWYSDQGASGEGYFYRATPLGRLPNPATDTIVCQYDNIISNFPTEYTGTTINLRLGDSNHPASGIWSGAHFGGMSIYGTSTAPVISGPINCSDSYFNGGVITGNINSPSNVYFQSPVVVNGNISGSGYRAIYSGTINGNITGTSGIGFYNGTINGTASTLDFSIYSSAAKMNGSLTVNRSFYCANSILPQLTLGAGVNRFELLASTLTNLTAISVSGAVIIDSSSIPRVTSITASGNMTLTRVDTTATLRSTFGGIQNVPNLTIFNSTVTGGISFANINGAWLKIYGTSVIGADISTAATNCAKFNIFGGTFTHPNSWVFGSANVAANISIGADIIYLGSNPNLVTSYTATTLGIFNKDITIYSNTLNNNRVYLNIIEFYNGYGIASSAAQYTTFTGVINILPTTGQSRPYFYVGGGDYRPTVTVAAIASGTNYSLTSSQLPFDWGFYRAERPQAYSPTIYVTGLPSGVDILATGI